MRRLADLNAAIFLFTGDLVQHSRLEFDCPQCEATHRIVVFIAEKASYWKQRRRSAMTGVFPDTLSLAPSIDMTSVPPCKWHGFVEDGGAR